MPRGKSSFAANCPRSFFAFRARECLITFCLAAKGQIFLRAREYRFRHGTCPILLSLGPTETLFYFGVATHQIGQAAENHVHAHSKTRARVGSWNGRKTDRDVRLGSDHMINFLPSCIVRPKLRVSRIMWKDFISVKTWNTKQKSTSVARCSLQNQQIQPVLQVYKIWESSIYSFLIHTEHENFFERVQSRWAQKGRTDFLTFVNTTLRESFVNHFMRKDIF